MLELRVTCSDGGCDATAVLLEGWENPRPELPQRDDVHGRWTFVLDTGWIDLPDGWAFGIARGRVDAELTFCPAHHEP